MARARIRALARLRQPHHVFAEGLHPADALVPRPLRLLHVRHRAGPARIGRTCRSTKCSPSLAAAPRPDATKRCSRWARRPRSATPRPPSGSPSTATPRPSTTSSPPAPRSATRPGLLPHANPGALTEDELVRLRAVSASQGMMIETLRADLAVSPRRARQDARAPPGHARSRRPRPDPVHDRHPRRHRRGPRRPHRRARGHRCQSHAAARPRARSHRAELPAEGRHGDAQRARRAPRKSSSGASPSPGCSCRSTCTCRRRRT